ncbi:hypothetical protein [Mesorhizobium sp. CN2-181]|uniref:hypothetical protein n=1 Tax=Mesorhizobium yinganensis TaxID=3157707 RepID=UPI0032B6FA61
MRGFVPFKSCLGDGASSAARQNQSILKVTDPRSCLSGDDDAAIAVETRVAKAGRPTLVELDRHLPMVDRRGGDVDPARFRFGGCVPGNGHEISGDRDVQSAAFGRFIVRAGKAVLRSLSRRMRARPRETGTAGGRRRLVSARWNNMPVADALVFAGLATGSSEKDCYA